MTVRLFKPEDHVPYRGVRNLVLWGTNDVREQMKNPLAHAVSDDNIRIGAFDEKDVLQSAITIVPFTFRMNGHEVKMGGIGAVVTLPEARGMGLVRKIMDMAFPVMLKNGQTFSFLYPFSYDYYRKFGYEMCQFNNNVNIPTGQFSGYTFPKNIRPHNPEDDITPFMDIYAHFAQDRNLSVVRSKKDWEDMLNRDPFKNHEFTYLNRDENGKPNAYILYHPARRENVQGTALHRLAIKELCWTTPRGLHDIFGFINKLSPEYDSVDWKVPCDINIHALFPDPYVLSYKRDGGGGMNRILDVTAGLSTLRAPQGSGKLALQITDAYWPSNSGTYTVEWESGHLTARKTDVFCVDMATGIETLAQLVTGSLTPEECMYKKDTKIYSNHTQLTTLFPKQKLHISEYF